jgi:hypothetical protein
MASASNNPTPPLDYAGDGDPDPLDGLHATMEARLLELKSSWSLPVYFDGVIGFDEAPDIFSFSSTEYRAKDKPYVFDPNLYPPTKIGLKTLLDDIKQAANEQGTRLVTGNKLGALICFRGKVHRRPANEKKSVQG